MTHKKIIKRENGDTVRIEVNFYDFNKDNLFEYFTGVEIKANGNTPWHYLNTAATPDEIYAAKLELWELLKPIK